MKFTDIKAQFRKDVIFKMIDCHHNSPIYEEVEDEYEGLIKEAYKKISANAVIAFGTISHELATDTIKPETPVLFKITTLGKEISDWSTELFARGNYMGGLLVNAMADEYLFQASELINPEVIALCKERKLGITKRLEAPGQMDMKVQKLAFDTTEAGKELGMGITDSYMLNPVKSLCQVFLLEPGAAKFKVDHNCAECDQVNCKMRHIVPNDSVGTMEILGSENISHRAAEGVCHIAIDIGTTTLAFALVEEKSGQVVKSYSTVNGQRRFGADVISRIQASVDGKRAELQEVIKDDLAKGIKAHMTGCDNTIGKIIIAGNTTMVHLLMGYDCQGMGIYPFTPYKNELIKIKFFALIDKNVLSIRGLDNTVTAILPGFSAFVGGDILSGLLDCDILSSKDNIMLIDLGTNGEMAIGNQDRLITTSTAAGPAFEGGNITCGMPSVQGAICSATVENNNMKVGTIGNKMPPIGICGTGLIEILYELLQLGLIDETGRLADEYFQNGYFLAKDNNHKNILITQKDIRELQMAKAAIRAGVETLLIRYGIKAEALETIYLAGGFGHKINVDKAIGMGLFPENFAGKIKSIGNGSLNGAIKYSLSEGQNPDGGEAIERIRSIATEINLANDKDFNTLYMDAMYFEF